MKKISLALCGLVTIVACNSRKVPQNLPKDISLKPPHRERFDFEQKDLKNLRQQIDSLSASVVCTNASDWRISPIGSKPCGGPAAYLAYPIKLEEEILPKIQQYSQREADFNRKNNMVSDCAITPMASGIKCENGKPVLINGTGGEL